MSFYRDKLECTANLDLANRSMPATLAYPSAAALLILWGPHYRLHLAATLGAFLAIVLASALRHRFAKQVQVGQGKIPAQVLKRFYVSCLLAGATWGLFWALSADIGSKETVWLVMLVSATIGGGAMGALAPGRSRLFTKFICLAYAPGLVVVLLGRSEISPSFGLALVGLTLIFLGYGPAHTRAYHEQLGEHVQRLDELHTARQRLEMVMTATELGTFDWLPKERRLTVDDWLWKVLEKPTPEPEAAFHTLYHSISPATRDDLNARVRETLEGTNRDGEVEATLLTSTGDPMVFVWRGTVIARDGNGQAERIVGTFRDVSERKKAEAEVQDWEAQVQQAEKLKTLGVLAGGVAHDFNNLLTAFVGQLELAELELDDREAVKTLLHDAKESALEASELCDQLLTYAGKRTPENEVFDLNRLIKKMSQIMRVSLPKNVELVLELATELPNLNGDKSQLRQVVLNLLTNAAEATGDKGGTVLFRTYRKPNNRIALTVTDDGCGMDAETVSKIFDPFYTTKFTGRGLGLAAVFGIVEGHGGKITVKSKPGKGTTFVVVLPSEPWVEKTPSLAEEASIILTRKTILLVEDEPTVREVCCRLLEKAGHNVATANDGIEALEYLAKEGDEVSLVLLDLTMPRMSGVETLQKIRQDLPLLPVILTSGYSEEEADLKAAPDYQGFLKKPFSRRTLSAALRMLYAGETIS